MEHTINSKRFELSDVCVNELFKLLGDVSLLGGEFGREKPQSED